MTISIHINTQTTNIQRPAQNIEDQNTIQTMELPQPMPATTQENIPPIPTAPTPTEYPIHLHPYSPVAIILATCALVTAIGKVVRPQQQ